MSVFQSAYDLQKSFSDDELPGGVGRVHELLGEAFRELRIPYEYDFRLTVDGEKMTPTEFLVYVAWTELIDGRISLDEFDELAISLSKQFSGGHYVTGQEVEMINIVRLKLRSRFRMTKIVDPSSDFQLMVHDRIGKEFLKCDFDNFQCGDDDFDDRWRVVESLFTYARDPEYVLDHMANLLLVGRHGTGKDHLAMAAAKAFYRSGYSVQWEYGESMFCELDFDAVEEIVSRYTMCDVLWISDLVQANGRLSSKRAKLFNWILDERMRHGKIVFLTLSTDYERDFSFERAFGTGAADRLLGGALRHNFTWDSYRMQNGFVPRHLRELELSESNAAN